MPKEGSNVVGSQPVGLMSVSFGLGGRLAALVPIQSRVESGSSNVTMVIAFHASWYAF